MDAKQKQAERELLELIEHCHATSRAFKKVMSAPKLLADFDALELNELVTGLGAVVEIEQAARRGLEKLRKPKGEP
jgi:hypothetical protein